MLPILKSKGVTSVIIRSDGAGYYHSAALMLSIDAISKVSGVGIERYSVSEAQNGKSTADAETSRFKRGISYWLNKGHDVNGPTQMLEALKDCGGRMKGFSAYHVRCPEPLKAAANMIKGISNYTDFEFFENKLIARKHFKIGKGLEIPYESAKMFEAVDLGAAIESHVFPGDDGSFWRIPKLQKVAESRSKTAKQPVEANDDEDPEGMYACDFQACEFIAISQQGLDIHKMKGAHKFSKQSTPLAKEALQLFIQEISGVREQRTQSLAPVLHNVEEQVSEEFVPKEGFAVRPQQQQIEKTSEMKEFLDEQLAKSFELGNKRVDPFEVARSMKHYQTADKKYFTAKQRLTPAQISSYYGQKIRKIRPKDNLQTTKTKDKRLAAKEINVEITDEEEMDDDPVFIDEATAIMENIQTDLPQLKFP
uniref:Uncharacterized protein n=1 Tax=Panagrolaimus sp. JU765 TaxID=591449 RepID=A0AC34RGK0_9BILA